MNINFNYKKREIEYISGYIFKGKKYRCSYIRYKSLYANPAAGAEEVQFYNYQPKGEVRASSIVLHGLGSSNIKFLLWIGPHLASAGVNTSIIILPGNYTRVEDCSVSGKSYLYPDLDIMYQFWEQGVVDVLSTIDLLEQMGLWKENNIITGYCLGGMIATIVSSLRGDIGHTLFMTAGGYIPKILHESPTTRFARRIFEKNDDLPFSLSNKEELYEIYDRDLELSRDFKLEELLADENIHPLLKIDPISYIKYLDPNKVTFVDALFDSTLPIESRSGFYKELDTAKRRILPITHVSWLPFSYFLAKYMLHKVNITDKESKKELLRSQKLENPFDK